MPEQDGNRAAAEYLRQLLLKPGRYRDTWQQHVARPREDVINQMAVAEVLAARAEAEHAAPRDGQSTAYQLRDVVSEALSGRQLSRHAIEMFTQAFGFAEHERDRLEKLGSGSRRISVLSGSHAVPADAEREVVHLLGPRRHETLSLHDHMYVGADGGLERSRTIQVIEATADDVDRIPFLCDTSALTIEVGQGCRELDGQVQRAGPGLFATHILLARTLQRGETTALDYWLTFRSPDGPESPSQREYRRAVMRQMENLDIRVEFHPDKLPARVWWAHWDGVEGGILGEEQVALDAEHSVQRFLRSLDKTVVGFRWAWR